MWVLVIFLGLVCLVSIIITVKYYIGYVKPIKLLVRVITEIDFYNNSVDFTQLDILQLKGSTDVKLIKQKFDEFTVELCERVDKVNEAIDRGDRDGLTGYYNINHLKGQKDLYEASNNFTIIFVDVNNLKRMNDEFGHEAGDTLLKNASKKLRFWAEFGDVYRVGGDEFMIVLVNKTATYIKSLIKSWYPSVGVLNRDSDGFRCVLSYGVAGGRKGDEFDGVRAIADSRMYKMKLRIKKQYGEPMR